MSNVVGMPGIANAIPPGEPVAKIVELLRKWLESAERGDLVQVLLAGVKRGGGSTTCWEGIASMDQSLAAATALQARVAWAFVSNVDVEDAQP